MNKYQLAIDKLNVKRRELAAIFETAGADLDLTSEQVDDVKSRNAEIADLAKEVETLREAQSIAEANTKALADTERVVRTVPHAGGTADQPSPERKTIGQMFVESAAYKEYSSSRRMDTAAMVPMGVKTLLQESAGFAPQAIRTGQVIPSAQQMPRVVDVIPGTTTTQNAVVFMRETTFTNAAVEKAEGAAYGEAALAYTEISLPVRKIPVFIPVTEEQLADIDGMADRINNRLALMVRQRLDSQIVNGDGTSNTLTGLLGTGSILTQAKGTDVNVDALYKALVQVRSVGFAEPSAFLLNPNDWASMRLLRTDEGIYIFGAPADPTVDRIWGLPVVQTTFLAQGTGITADFPAFTELATRSEMEFAISNSHSDFFTSGKLAVRCIVRVCFVVLRPAAVCAITGLS
jgi:HK97 family phage major capsid protein